MSKAPQYAAIGLYFWQKEKGAEAGKLHAPFESEPVVQPKRAIGTPGWEPVGDCTSILLYCLL